MTQLETTAAAARSFLDSVVGKAGLALEPTRVQLEEETVVLSLEGEDSELLLTDGARLLYALNHLVNQVFFRRGRPVNFVLDCQNYRQIRAYELELMARKAAERAQALRQKVALQPMTSSERRIIHLTLAEDETVRTESEGSGSHRRVLIVPA